MKIVPHTKDEWIAFCLLPAKVFFAAFFVFILIPFSGFYFEFRSPRCEAILGSCFYLSGPFLLVGALVQGIFCKRGSASSTLWFMLAILGVGYMVALSPILILWVPFAWLLWRFVRPTVQHKSSGREEPVECMNCHETIPVGESRCGKCGWSFNE